MALDTTALDKSIADLATQATQTEGTEASAALIIKAQGTATATAVEAALKAQGVTDQAIIDAATSAVTATTARFLAADGPLGEAIAANPGTPQA